MKRENRGFTGRRTRKSSGFSQVWRTETRSIALLANTGPVENSGVVRNAVPLNLNAAYRNESLVDELFARLIVSRYLVDSGFLDSCLNTFQGFIEFFFSLVSSRQPA